MITWLIKLTGGKGFATLILALIVAAIAATLFGKGYSVGYHKADQKALVKELQASNSALQLLVNDTTLNFQKAEALTRENNQLTQDLAAAKGKERIVYRTIRESAEHLVSAEADAPATTGRDGLMCTFSGRYVSLWNAALAPDSAAVGDDILPEATGDAADALAVADLAQTYSSIDGRELLANHIDNAEIDSEVRRQCTALIDWHHQHDNSQ